MFQGLLNIESIWVQHRVSPEPFKLSLWNFHRMLILYKTFIWTNNKKYSHVTFGEHFGSHIEIWKMPIYHYFLQKIDKHPSTSSIKDQDLFWYIVSSEINQSIAVEALNAFYMSSPWTCFQYFYLFKCIRRKIKILVSCILYFLISAKTHMFVKSILVQKIAYASICDIIMSPEHFENTKQRVASFITV